MGTSRNAPCPCGSGKKYKKCCLLQEQQRKQEKLALTPPPPILPEPMLSLEVNEIQSLRQGHRDAAIHFANDSVSDPLRFLQALSWLDYEGHLELSIEARRTAWSIDGFQEALPEWHRHTFLETTFLLERLQWKMKLQSKQHSEHAEEWMENLKFYLEDPAQHADLEAFESNWSQLLGHTQHTWDISDFAFQSRKQRIRTNWNNYTDEDIDQGIGLSYHIEADPAREKLTQLSFAFVRYLNTQKNVEWSRGELARQSLELYIQRRVDGTLKPIHETVSASPFSPRKTRVRIASKNTRAQKPHRLCPDAVTLERFLADQLGILSGPNHLGAFAMMEYLPVWFAFLLECGLLPPHIHDRTIRELKDLAQAMLQFSTQYWSDHPSVLQDYQQRYSQNWQ